MTFSVLTGLVELLAHIYIENSGCLYGSSGVWYESGFYIQSNI